MAKKGHREGGKFKGHTTVIEAALPVVDMISNLVEVTGISIAKIEKTNSVAQQTVVTYKETISGLEVKVRGNKYVQTFYLYSGDASIVATAIDEHFPKPERKHKKRQGRRKGRQSHPSAANWESS